MQTKSEADVGVMSGARQVPVLRRDQIVPGLIFTGIAADHAHEVIAIEGETMHLQRLPRDTVEAEHVHAFTQYDNTTCACGFGRRNIALFLPEDGTTPRMHALVPVGPVRVPEPCSVYLFAGPRTLVIGDSRTTIANSEVPLVLKACKVWSLPEAARRLIAAQQSL